MLGPRGIYVEGTEPRRGPAPPRLSSVPPPHTAAWNRLVAKDPPARRLTAQGAAVGHRLDAGLAVGARQTASTSADNPTIPTPTLDRHAPEAVPADRPQSKPGSRAEAVSENTPIRNSQWIVRRVGVGFRTVGRVAVSRGRSTASSGSKTSSSRPTSTSTVRTSMTTRLWTLSRA